MNQKLQNIFDLIQQSETLNIEQKDILLEAVKDADKELEITAFKLERTEKVKKTTAILLEETIEELEQKRNAVEKQNRELEIESALEKVRTIAMGMRMPADMLDICKTISLQLQYLGIKEIRNVQTAIFYEQRGTYMNYEFYAKHDKTIITETSFTNHEMHNEFAKKMLSGKGEVFITHIIGDEVKDWIAYQKTTNVFIDKYLETASSINYYWFSLGPVALGISTYHPLTEEEIDLFKRFLKVFELAYQRYLDIEKAEAQAREARIETALERVRSRTMAMHKSAELKEVIKVVLEQFVHLNINVEHAGFYIDYKANDDMHIWLADPNIEPFYATLPYFDTPTWNSFLDAKAKGKNFHTDLLDFEEKNKFYRSLFEFFEVPEDAKKFYLECQGLAVSTVLLDNVGLYIENFSGTSYSDEENKILMRFGKVFQQTYTRFLDLQKSEAQAKEAQIQLALERVRARSLAMHNTSELQEVVNIAAQQLHNMNLDINGGVFIAINDEVDKDLPLWASGGAADYVQKVTVPFLNKPVFTLLRDAIRRKNNFFTEEHSYEEKIELFEHLFKYPPWNSHSQERRQELLSREGGYTRSVAISKYTSISITNHNGKKFSDDDNEILKRFGNVFEQSYIRFLDLQKAEAQARESQIQLALERVRARTMAMHKSDELAETSTLIFEQLQFLGIIPQRCGFVIPKDDESMEIWGTVKNDKVYKSYKLGIIHPKAHPIFTLGVEEWRKGSLDFSYTLTGSSLRDYYTAISVSTNMPENIARKIIKKTVVEYHYNAFFKHGSITTIFQEKPDEANRTVIRRFAKVLEQTYTRFLDLQKAEAQARESQIEAALEKIRSRSLAMQKSEELAETAAVLFQQLHELGYVPDRITIGIMKEDERYIELWSTDQVGNKISHIFKASIDEPTTWSKIYHQWKAKAKSLVIDLSGLELNEWIRYVREDMRMFINEEVLKENRRVHSVSFFSHGFIMMSTIEAMALEKIDVLERFSLVFNQTYTRFLDLKRAEYQAREAQIEAALERVRSKTLAMHTSEELADASSVVFQQLINLGIEPNRIYIAIIKNEKGDAEFWITDEDGSKVNSKFEINLNDNSSFKKMFEGWKEHKKSITIYMQGEELKEYFNHLIRLGVPFKEGPSQKRRMQYLGYFSKGFIGVASPDETKPETLLLLERFAAVFNLTYTRFNDLLQAEEQNRIIQAENERKTKELEDARRLQLSMLPKELPRFPLLDIAVYMKTTTEVGGDYYDFNVDINRTLTVLVGDATGHGMMSGMMVSIMKSFFISNRNHISLKEFFENVNNSIKDMKLGRLMMALMGVQISSDEIIATSAGMPPLIYYRNKSGKAGEFVINNLPLGGMKGIKYSLKKIKYEKGDTLLMMSDGFAESKNNKGEQFGYERIKEEFKSVIQKNSNEIVKHLTYLSSKWIDGKEPDDDITFVVIKIK